ncbi:hypothetical protein [Mesobacterium pallidum]|uniref:hypothetical protein n=1 Tax=Mesobacterium pallidum TaxID=2872037 RepID=UPI001EE2E42A|nr:hypothetical protein [Mesobacterium pallidum]
MATPQECNEAFEDAEDEFGDDSSTEFLAQVAADRLGIQAHEVIEGMASLAGPDGKIPPAKPGRY